MMRRRWLFRMVCLACIWALAACTKRSPTPDDAVTALPARGTPTASSLPKRTFEALWSAVNENYLDEEFGGIDWQAIHEQYAAKVETGLNADEFAATMRAMLAELPEEAAVLQTRAERLEAQSVDRARFEGIGAFVAYRPRPEPHVVLLAVMPDSPAKTAGLGAHDSILAIGGQPVTAEEGQAVVQRIRGPAGSDVTLRVKSPGRAPRDVVVTRGSITASDALTGGALGDGTIGYLLFPAAAPGGLADDVVRAVQALNSPRKLRGLILDLRISTAGGAWPLSEVMTLFADGELGEVFTRESVAPIAVAGQDISDTQTLPLAIIVGPDTQGAPEIFAAAMQSIGRASIVGMPTPGAVEVVEEFPLPDGSRAFIVTGSYRTPQGRDVGREGVEPDVKVDLDWDEVSQADDAVRAAAARALRLSSP